MTKTTEQGKKRNKACSNTLRCFTTGSAGILIWAIQAPWNMRSNAPLIKSVRYFGGSSCCDGSVVAVTESGAPASLEVRVSAEAADDVPIGSSTDSQDRTLTDSAYNPSRDAFEIPPLNAAAGRPRPSLNLSRKHRLVQPALRRVLEARDRGCRFPGCSHERWLGAHHVVHWADGGEISLENTLLLCDRHHRLLHEGGFAIRADANGEWQFQNAKGMKQIQAGW